MMYYPTNLLLDLFDLLKFLFRNFASMYMRFLQIFFCNAFGYGTYMYIKSEFCRGQRIKPGSYASNYVLIALLAATLKTLLLPLGKDTTVPIVNFEHGPSPLALLLPRQQAICFSSASLCHRHSDRLCGEPPSSCYSLLFQSLCRCI